MGGKTFCDKLPEPIGGSLESILKAGPLPSPLRSRVMASVRSQNTKPEIALRRALHASGLRFRLQHKALGCKPDILLPGRRLAIFVHGCFWHQHEGCKFGRKPKSRLEFWNEKFRRNRRRDATDIKAVRKAGWTPIVVWECELKNGQRLCEIVNEVTCFDGFAPHQVPVLPRPVRPPA